MDKWKCHKQIWWNFSFSRYSHTHAFSITTINFINASGNKMSYFLHYIAMCRWSRIKILLKSYKIKNFSAFYNHWKKWIFIWLCTSVKAYVKDNFVLFIIIYRGAYVFPLFSPFDDNWKRVSVTRDKLEILLLNSLPSRRRYAACWKMSLMIPSNLIWLIVTFGKSVE